MELEPTTVYPTGTSVQRLPLYYWLPDTWELWFWSLYRHSCTKPGTLTERLLAVDLISLKFNIINMKTEAILKRFRL